MPSLPGDPTPTLLEALQDFQRDMAAARPSSRFSFAAVPWREIYTGRWTFPVPPSPYRGYLDSAYADTEPEDL